MATLVSNEAAAAVFDEHVELLTQISEILAAHPNGSAIRLVFGPTDLQLGTDEILVQNVNIDDRSLTLRPKSISDLLPSDLLHESQVVGPLTENGTNYVKTLQAASCLTRYNLAGECVHIYD